MKLTSRANFSNSSFTFPFENRKNIAVIALSPDSNVLISVDEGTLIGFTSPWRALSLLQTVALCSSTLGEGLYSTTSTSSDQSAHCSSRLTASKHAFASWPAHADNLAHTLRHRYIAVTHDAHVQVWRTPNHMLREFAPFELHRTYTGHHDETISIQWSSDSTWVHLFTGAI